MRLFTEMQSITGGVAISRRNVRRSFALAAAGAAVAASTQLMPAAFATTPNVSVPGLPSSYTLPIGSEIVFGYTDLIDAADTVSIDAILNNQAVSEMHTFELISKSNLPG